MQLVVSMIHIAPQCVFPTLTHLISASLITINPYFLAQLLLSHGQALAGFTADDIFGPAISNSPHVNIWLDNIDAIGRAFQGVSSQGFRDFISLCHGNMNVMCKYFGLLGDGNNEHLKNLIFDRRLACRNSGCCPTGRRFRRPPNNRKYCGT